MSTLTQPISTARASSEAARPIFVFGCQRSGTTALAVMLDRHSRIAMLPETQFFCHFVRTDRRSRGPMTHEALAQRATTDFFMREAKLDAAALLEPFVRTPPTYPNLFRAMLEAYAHKHGKPRPAEKSCDHLFHTRAILNLYPQAKLICIVRDGRDVVRSILGLGWNRSSPFPVAAHCGQWNRSIREGRRLARVLPQDRFTTVLYEDLMIHPERELRRLCEFMDVAYEPTQLASGASSDVVPQYELGWKGKAKDAPDPSRVAAWRKCDDPSLIAQMNYYMGPNLRAYGYPETEVVGVPMSRRVAWQQGYLPYRRGVFPITKLTMRAVRVMRGQAAASPGGEG